MRMEVTQATLILGHSSRIDIESTSLRDVVDAVGIALPVAHLPV
jgi:hypothetical protein